MCQIIKLLVTIILLLTTLSVLKSQNNSDENFTYNFKKANQKIIINGKEDENEWSNVEIINIVYNHYPYDTGFADSKTEVKMTYDDDNIYVFGKCYDNGERVVQTLQRDKRRAHWNSDNLTIALDPIRSKQNGFMFGVNAGGAQFEATLSHNGARTNSFESWDNKWQSKVKQYKDYWIVEMAIPFKSLRYKKELRQWNLNIIRSDAKSNAIYTWKLVPLNFRSYDFNFMGTLNWEQPAPKSGRKYSIIPYSIVSSIKDYESTKQENTERELKIGGDVKVALTSSLNLDLTINPDFSNADVDREVTNITRFSIYLPERRNFFLENHDIFSNFGGNDIKPFFSRKIGLNNGAIIPIKYGARLTGNLNKSTRVGIMNVQSSKKEELEAQNYTVAAIQKQVLARSVIKSIFISRQTTGSENDESYTRNIGVEFIYVSKDGTFSNTAKFHSSHTESNLSDNLYYGFSGNYTKRRLRLGWSIDRVEKNYITDVGINPRLENYNAETGEYVRIGYLNLNPYIRYLFFPSSKSSKIIWHGIRTWSFVYLNDNGSLNETENNLSYDFNFKNTSWLSFFYKFRKVNLPLPTSFLGDFDPLPAIDYSFSQFNARFNSDNRKVISLRSTIGFGEFFNGTRSSFDFGLKIRAQSWVNFGIAYKYNDIRLPNNFGKRKLHLLRINGNISFSNKMFFTNVFQLNSQNENLSIFSRFQWRYKPMSDLFIIFNKNFNTDGYVSRNQGLILKLTYWF